MFGPRLQLVYFLRNIYKNIYNGGKNNTRVRKTYKDFLSDIKYTELNGNIFKSTAGTLTTSRAVITFPS